ncbi:MAG TPA: single-stranded-DNA-specific exonuclease RecJ, partial [Gammaproteobacteria bacterium]
RAADAANFDWPTDLHPVVRRVLLNRDIRSAEELELKLDRLRPVGEFGSLDAAVELLGRHFGERIVIVGDFDADGATSTALMTLCLSDLGFRNVSFFIPDRFELGYGLTPEVVDRVRDLEPRLIVTVDNGVTSIAGVGAARDAGIDVLITDHHLPGDELPDANAIVNPNLTGDPFDGKSLAGVGVAFYLLAALGKSMGAPTRVAEYLDLVALGTIADLVPLDHSNRILVEEGLRRIRAGRCRPGLRALCEVSAVATRDVTGETLAFQIAPRLNAAGRLDDMTVGVRCLTSSSDEEARALAARLDALNRERRTIEQRMKREAAELVDAEELLGDLGLPPVVCLHREDWHEGIVGLVASRIKDRCHRPVFAFAKSGGGLLKGSGRSIPGFHLRDALAEIDAVSPGLIERFGGHAMAAGLTLEDDNLEAFRLAIEALGEARLGPEHLAQRILTDGELGAHELTVEVAESLRDAGPWGQAFPEPVFEGRFELVRQRIVGEKHLKMTLKLPDAQEKFDAIAFNRLPGDWLEGDVLRLVYRLAVNDYHYGPPVQLIIEHIEAPSIER